jgi:hypothetical protein
MMFGDKSRVTVHVQGEVIKALAHSDLRAAMHNLLRGYVKVSNLTAAVVNESIVRDIRKNFRPGRGQPEENTAKYFEEKYGLSEQTVRAIINWKTWYWVSQDEDGTPLPSVYHPESFTRTPAAV